MVSKSVASVHKNAQRLLADAELLYAHGRYESATALSVLAMEEAGKACLIGWKEEGLLKKDIIPLICRHFSKQRVYYSFVAAEAFLGAIEEFYSNASNIPPISKSPNEFESARHFAQYLWRTAVLHVQEHGNALLTKRWHEKAVKEALYAETGTIDLLKQVGFYSDINDNLETVLPSGMPDRVCADEMLRVAKAAVDMPTKRQVLHHAMAAKYNVGPVFGTPDQFGGRRAAAVQALKSYAESSKLSVV